MCQHRIVDLVFNVAAIQRDGTVRLGQAVQAQLVGGVIVGLGGRQLPV